MQPACRLALRRALFCSVLPAFLLPGVALAQHDHAAMASSPIPAASAELGNLSFPTSTRSPQAQAAFERGMLWLHLFEDDHAVEEFHKAQQLDPDFALAYWGEAMTHTRAIWNIDDPDGARQVLAKLGPTPQARAAKAPTAREKAFLDTGEQLFGPGTVKQRDTRFLAAATALAKRYPDDDEAQLLHALALLGITRGDRNVPNYLQAAEISQRVLAHNPRHPGAAHYWIHGMDDPAHADGALQAARVLARIAPGAGHAQHMTSHIFMSLGMWDDVIAANEAAMRVVNAEPGEAGQPAAMNCGHYDDWLQYAYYQAGRAHDAQKAFAACERDGAAMLAWAMARPKHSTARLADFQKSWHLSLVGMRATALVESAQDRDYDAALRIDTDGLGHLAGWDVFARAYAALQAGDVKAARAGLLGLQAIARQAPDDNDALIPHTDAYLGIMEKMLDGAIAVHEGHADAGLALIHSAAAQYDALPFDFGPPVPLKPPHELAGEALLGSGRPRQALPEFEAALKLAPRRALSMLGRARALRAMGDASGAARAYAELATLWHGADADLPALAEVRAGADARTAVR